VWTLKRPLEVDQRYGKYEMKNMFFQLLAILTFILIFTHVSNATNYRRSGKFHALKLTYDDISELLNRMNKIIPPPKTEEEQRYVRNSVTIGDGELQVQVDFNDDLKLKELGRLPSISYDFSYSFYCKDGKIEDVSIRFSDYEREVSVAGKDPDQVNALYVYISDEINKHITLLGGSKFRIICVSFLFIFGLLLLILPEALGRIDVNLSNKQVALTACFGLILIVTATWLPFEKWLPGLVIYSQSTSAFVRYAAQISFCGMVFGAISIILACISLLRPKTRLSQNEKDRNEQKLSEHIIPTKSPKKKIEEEKYKEE
jgi:hypothetical protein